MPSSKQAAGRPTSVAGRTFATADPERRREVIGYVRSPGVEAASARSAAVAKPAGQSWMRVQPDVEGSFEGSSSGRWR